MKKIILAVAALAALGGCAVQQPYYASRPVVSDPYQWHTVSMAPSDRAGGASSGGNVQYTNEDAPRVVYSEPVYGAPVYAPPVYYAPAPAYYYPPVSIGLDFGFGGWCCRGGGGWGRGGWGRGGHRR